jgi:hypothetical protein
MITSNSKFGGMTVMSGLTFLLFLLALVGNAMAAEHTFDFPIGSIIVRTSDAGGEAAEHRSVSALFINKSTPLLRLNFDQYGPGFVQSSSAVLPGLPSPIVFVVSGWSRADGGTANINLVAFVQNRLRVLLQTSVEADAQDAFCINGASGQKGPSLALLKYNSDGEYCVMCWPKYYDLTSYRWTGHSFIKSGMKKGHRLNADWKWAKDEFGVRCDLEILSHTVTDP